jgi:sulfatase maturation enzyme AslB (radical SAM superfamily)
MKKVIFYGASRFAQKNFINLCKDYSPLCFCDRAAKNGQSLFNLPVLPPTTMFAQYPDAPILLTVALAIKYDVQAYLIDELNIPAERIINFEPYEIIRACSFLESYLRLSPDEVFFCCEGRKESTKITVPSVHLSAIASPEDKIKAVRKKREYLRNAIKMGAPCECDGCPLIKSIRWSKSSQPQALDALTLQYEHGCNINCSYCTLRTKTKEINTTMYRNMIDELIKGGEICSYTSFKITCGEITTFPQREEILSMIKNYPNHIFSNCILYDEKFAAYIRIGNSIINCSLDAGTRETYAKVKGVDCFEQVCNNLEKYAKHAKIELKYVFLHGLNDNENDISGFVNIVKKLNCKHVLISRDFNKIIPFDDTDIYLLAKLILLLQKISVHVVFTLGISDEDAARINLITKTFTT